MGAAEIDTPRPWPTIIGGWALAAIVLCLALSGRITALRFPDPDDAMRLLEVRDWMAGQSWWDVGQHRLNGGAFAMHWSRLVDLPLAGIMFIVDPFVSTGAANRIAMTIVPLVTLLAVMALAAELTLRTSGVEQAKLAVLLAPLSIPILYQMHPLRIDHHGWQIVCAMAAVTLLVGRATARAGMLAGLTLAILITISLEGMPVALAIIATAALAWAWDPTRARFLVGLSVTFFVASLAFQIATRGPAMFAAVCDAVSPGWLAVLGSAAAALSIATLVGSRGMAVRLIALVLGAVACGSVLMLTAPECLRGPFATLDPLVYRVWYQNVDEGLPVWHQGWSIVAITFGFPLIGLVGGILACRRAHGAARFRWILLLGVLLSACVLAAMVIRSGATANALALPGGASLLLVMLERVRRIVAVVPRTLATAAALVTASPGLAAGAVFMTLPSATQHPMLSGPSHPPCHGAADVRALAQLPSARLFAPLDVTPEILNTTRHQAIASGYHRNTAAIHRVIAAFTERPDQARRLIDETHAGYLVACPGMSETDIYREIAPNGLWARLERGERFAWLTPVPIAGSPVLAWRVNNLSRAPLSGAPVRP
ncbi:hypothetical protein VH567_13210 [Sphingomonas sp. 4RDLI-65]|uniref:hypothetical protein n=1 Tax=Sphingomonas sp. 4RDLI-65 TaxID=3111641 RepID=UPI003C28D279